MTGTKVVYISNRLDAEGVGRAVRENKITVLLATPTFLQAYMRKCPPERMRSLRLVITGAEKLRDDIARKFKRLYGLEVIEGYGATELSPIVAINVSGSILDLGKRPGRKGSIGPPMPGICVKITDPETGRELPPGWEGLMCVKGPNVMQGYLEDRKKTAEVLIDGWYNTGDIARMDTDGYLTITGRLSRFSKIAGEMVPHELVEKSIFEILRSENRCIAVCGVPDKSKGEKLVVLHTKLKISVVEIIEKLRKKKLPGLWIPRQRDFYEVKELPLLGSGKLDLVKAQEKAMEVAGATSLCYQYRDRNGKQHSEK
jgi:acyl-[acyl-carrier-protein]-phospholipid O-acyltransferase/long-chain-fatty-acid--[acyl-carrier-protein] ligase